MTSFTIATNRVDGVLILRLSGCLDSHSKAKFKSFILDHLSAGDHRVVLDCSGILYIGSAGLADFIEYSKEARRHSGDIKISAFSESISKIVVLLGFNKYLHTYETLELALEAFK